MKFFGWPRRLWTLVAALLLLASACGSAEGESQPTPSAAAPTFTPAPSPTALPSPTPTATVTPPPASPTPTPTATVTPPPASPAPATTATGHIAFLVNSSSGRLKKHDIYIVNDDGTNLVRLTEEEGDHENLRWSPDGAWLAFASTRGGQWDVYLTSADGEQLRRVTQTRGREYTLAWSPDGRYLSISGQNPDGRPSLETPDILVYDVESERLINITNTRLEAETSVTWSPDGQYLVFTDKDHFLVRVDASCIDDPDTCWDTAFELGVQTHLPIWRSSAANAIGYGALQEGRTYATLITPQGEPLRVLDSVPLVSDMGWVNPSSTGNQVILPVEGWAYVVWDIAQDKVASLARHYGALSPQGDKVTICLEDDLVIFDLEQATFQEFALPVTPSCYSIDWGPPQDATSQ